MKTFFALSVAMCLFVSTNAQISGSFTVYGASPDYSNLQAALDDLQNQTIDGPVILNIRSGTYPEQIIIDSIPGASENAPVIIQSESLDSSTVKFNFAASEFGNDFVFKFNSCSWVTLQDITIQPLGPGGFNNYTRAIEFVTQSHHNTINQVHFLGRPFVNSLTVYSAQGSFSEYNTISSCHFKYGGTAISFRNDGGFSLPNGKGLNINNCLFEDQQYAAISAINNDDFVVNGNSVINPEEGNNISAFYFGNIDQGGVISNNQIYIKGNNGIEVSNADNPNTSQTKIYNNMVSLWGNSYGYALVITAPGNTSATNNGFAVSFNSLSVSNEGEKRALVLFRLDEAIFKNNILFIDGEGIPLLLQDAVGEFVAFYNNCLFSESGDLVQEGLNGPIYSTVLSLEESLLFIQNTLSIDPQFVSIDDLHATNINLANAGTPVESITEDIDGEPRDELNPSIGADEIDSSPLTLIHKKSLSFQVFPNPTKDFVYMDKNLDVEVLGIELLNSYGQKVRAYNASEFNSPLSLRSLSKGLYFLHLRTKSSNFISPILLN